MEDRCNDSDVYVACKIDISQYVTDEKLLEKCGGKIFYSGFFNDSVAIHICSFTPHAYVDVIGIVPEEFPEDDDDRIETADALDECHDIYDSGYYTLSHIKRMREAHPERFKVIEINFSEPGLSDAVKYAEIREVLSGDPIF